MKNKTEEIFNIIYYKFISESSRRIIFLIPESADKNYYLILPEGWELTDREKERNIAKNEKLLTYIEKSGYHLYGQFIVALTLQEGGKKTLLIHRDLKEKTEFIVDDFSRYYQRQRGDC